MLEDLSVCSKWLLWKLGIRLKKKKKKLRNCDKTKQSLVYAEVLTSPSKKEKNTWLKSCWLWKISLSHPWGNQQEPLIQMTTSLSQSIHLKNVGRNTPWWFMQQCSRTRESMGEKKPDCNLLQEALAGFLHRKIQSVFHCASHGKKKENKRGQRVGRIEMKWFGRMVVVVRH